MLEGIDILAEKIGRLALEAVALEWRNQGHELTGNAVKQLKAVTVPSSGGVLVQGFIVDYMANLNQGVPASKIPYNPGSGARSSQYISGLIDYARKRMGASSDREAEEIAHKIASRHKREGMPTINSARFSKSGKRTGFIEQALTDVEPKLAALIETAVEAAFTQVIESFFASQLNR